MAFERAKIHYDKGSDGSGEIEVLFNPNKYSITNAVEYNQGTQQHKGKVPSTLTVVLFFDTTEEGTPVLESTQRILDLMKVNTNGTPALCTFVWGKLIFKGVITSVDQKFIMFLESGAPVRAELTVNFTATEKVRAKYPDVPGKKAGVSDGAAHFSSAALEEKYKKYFVPFFNIEISGQNLRQQGLSIDSLTVDTSTEKADSFSFTVINAYNDQTREIQWVKDMLTPGKPVAIAVGYGDEIRTIFNGYITSLEYRFSGGKKLELIVSGMDASFKMMKGVKFRSWLKKKHSDIAREIAASYSLSQEIDPTPVTLPIVEQSKVTDYQFLSWMAAQNNFEFFIVGGTMYFRKPYQKKTPVIELEWDSRLTSLNITHDIGDQTGSIVVRGWDPVKKEQIEAKSNEVNKLNSNGATGTSFIADLCGSEMKDYIYTNAESVDEAQKMATAISNQRSLKLISGRGESIGIPEITAGRYLNLKGAGVKLSQLYYIVAATHIINTKEYKTIFTLGGNAI